MPILEVKLAQLRTYSLLTAIVLFCNISTSRILALESTVPSINSVSEITIEILKREIALERFLLKYKILGNKEPKFRRLRYFLGQQASLALFLGGDIVTIEETGKHLSSPAKVSSNNLKNALGVELIGSIIGSASSFAEVFSNGLIAIKNKKHKEDPHSATILVQNRLKKIDQLLVKRNNLIDQEKNNPIYKIMIIEGSLLKDYRDWCVYEFSHIYADVKAYQASENLYYFLNGASNALYSVSGGLAIKSFQNTQTASSSIITGLTGDSISIVSAPASYYARKFLYKHYAKKIYRKLQERVYDIETDSADNLELLQEEVARKTDSELIGVGQIKSRLSAYELWNQKYDEYLGAEMEFLRHYDKIALQSTLFGPLISGTFLGQDILDGIAYYRDSNKLKAANGLTFAGAITAGAGSIVGLGATSWYFLDETMNQRKLRREGKLPEQLLLQRLKTLDQVETLINK